MSDFTQATTKFNKWLILESVAVSPKVEIADLREKNEGRGLVAIVDIAEDEALFTLPRSVIINRENCSLVLDIPLFKEKLSELNHWESLIIVLLYELKVKGDSSRWSPYFNILPVVDFKNYTYNQLAFWLEGELKELLPSLILERVGKDMAQEMYAKLCPIVQELGLKELEGFTLEEYHRIASLIMSYSFDVEKGDDEDEEEVEDEDEEEDEVDEDNDNSNLKSMVPLADTLNADTSLHNAHLTYTDGN